MKQKKKFIDIVIGDKIYYLNCDIMRDVPFDIPAYDIPYMYSIETAVVTSVEIVEEEAAYTPLYTNRGPRRLHIGVRKESGEETKVIISLNYKINDYEYAGWFANYEDIYNDIKTTYERKLEYWSNKVEMAEFFKNFYNIKIKQFQ